MRENGVSVIICCYNASKRLEPTLTHLFSQQFSKSLNWEIIVVDNASADSTAQIAQQLFDKSGTSIAFKVVYEPKPGLSFARECGFRNSRYDIALMVDDDNWLCPNYVQAVHSHFENDGNLGMVGGLGLPEISGPTPDWFDRYAYCYATGHQSETTEADLLYGAGLALRLSHLDKLRNHGFSSILSDRVGDALISGGDTELCMAFRMAGFRLKYDRTISFRHQLPDGRLKWSYLRRLFYGFGITKAKMDIYTAALSGQPMPADGRLPFWFNRIYFLSKRLLSDLPVLLRGRFNELEGDELLLKATAKLGHIEGLWNSRTELISLYEQVYKLRDEFN
jgi:glycosyltransferase involved in cell wall biosynthesis